MGSPGKKAYPLRIDPALWSAIERMAAQELRSANAQIEFLLREGLTRRGWTASNLTTSVGEAPAESEPESEPPIQDQKAQ